MKLMMLIKQSCCALMLAAIACLYSCTEHTLFEKVSSSHSGIDFTNTIVEDDTINPLDLVNLYHGGGVGAGDFNNDGLQDLYFVGNQVPSKMYLNKGDFKFEDITEDAAVEGKGRWGRGVAVVDVNSDGLMDLYVCNGIRKDSLARRNILYVNQGINKQGTPVFKDMAAEYGLDAHVESTTASFFDYDNDGDLDMYLTVNEANSSQNPNLFASGHGDALIPSRGKLFRNDWNAEKKHPSFTDVSRQAGITIAGYGLSTTIADINQDGWKDISVANDYMSSNILYINNGDGTFTDRSKEYFKHTSFNAMGQDITDLNNDGLADLFELDMNPEDNFRKKMMMGPNSDVNYYNFDYYGYQYQYVRNTLQLNQGPRIGQNDSIGAPAFSEVSFMSGVAQTDWSWAPLITDFDNDGFRDIIVGNGYPRDVTDHDFLTYRQEAYATSTKKQLLEQIPIVKIHNYAFRNNGDLTFQDASKNWGLMAPTFTNGAVYVDLNNDGAMDVVMNNINDEALIYKNTVNDKKDDVKQYLQVRFKGAGKNRNGLGVVAEIFYNHNKRQVFENNPYRGYLSTQQSVAHFGLNKISTVDSLVIKWPEGRKQVLRNVKAGQVITVDIRNADQTYSWAQPKLAKEALFKEVTNSLNLNYWHNEFSFIDFQVQKLLPHKLSEYSPALAVADVDGNGLDDLVIGGNAHDPAQIFLQQKNGKFTQKAVMSGPELKQDYKDAGILLFDADGDGDADLYMASGGYKNGANTPAYQDRLYLNDGKGSFRLAPNALPKNYTSKMCVRSVDYNKDGRLDLFVSGRVEPGAYPKPVSSIILRNDSKDGKVKFTDVSDAVAPALRNAGLVCDALFTDFDNDNWPDLIMAGEWMPITFLRNNKGKFENVTTGTGLSGKTGWWNTIIAGDFRNTGRMDYIVGNTGLNTIYQVNDQFPAYITAKDFDNNGGYTAIPSLFFPDINGEKKEFPAHGREDMLKQMISLKKKFTNYKSFATATMDEILSPEQRQGAIRLKTNTQQSCYLRNEGDGKFTMIPLPQQAQLSVLNGMVVDDFDQDGQLDIAVNGNDYGTDVSTGRYDALNGLLLKGDGKGNFRPLSILQSGIYFPGNGKALVKLQSTGGKYMLAASQNKGKLQVLELKRPQKMARVNPSDLSATIKYKDGRSARQEFYYGSSFLSQSGRYININNDMASVTIVNSKGLSRSLQIN
jgi:hypothetical protein